MMDEEYVVCAPYDPVNNTTQLIPVPLSEAQTRIWVPRPDGERQDELWVNQGAGGLGDTLLGLCAVKGLRRLHPNRRIVYRVPEKWAGFAALFDAGYDGLAEFIWDRHMNNPGHLDMRDLQINADYFSEIKKKAPLTRIDRYAKNLGGIVPEIPPLRNPAQVREQGKDYTGTVILAPFSSHGTREYPVMAWMTIERRLREMGYRVVVIGIPDERRDVFDCEWIENPHPQKVAGILLNCACLLANDSGPAHLAGLLGTRTIVLCGPTVGSAVYSLYPTVRHLNGHLACSGCFWNAPYEDKTCVPVCASLASISPDAVLMEVTMHCLLNGEPREHRPGLEAEPDQEPAPVRPR